MTKYSTGSAGGDGATSCELCGAESGSLERTRVAGAVLEVCRDCAPHGDRAGGDTGGGSGGDGGSGSDRGTGGQTGGGTPIWDGDTDHWEREGTNYDDDPLPYLVAGYGDRLREARRSAGLQRDELAAELELAERELLAIEQGRATQTGVGGGVIAALEDRLDVTLSEGGRSD